MSLVNNLLASAALIRDASQEGENTALRVGGFLVSLIQAIVQSLPDKVVDGDVIGAQSTDSSFVISMRTKDSNGQIGERKITIPIASADKAGLMTGADRANLTSAIANATQALLNANQALSAASNADAASSEAAENAATAIADAAEALDKATKASELVGGAVALSELDNIGQECLRGRVLRVTANPGDTVGIGTLFCSSCFANHTWNQTLMTYLPLDANGEVTTSHTDNGEMHIYTRTYNVGQSSFTVEPTGEVIGRGIWSRWHEIAGDAKMDRSSMVTLSEAEFESLTVKDNKSYYFIYED